MSAGTAKTPQAVEGEARQPGPEGETPKPLFSKESPMTEQRARELLAAEYENSGFYQRAGWVRTSPSITGSDQIAIRAITTALAESAKSPSDSVSEALERIAHGRKSGAFHEDPSCLCHVCEADAAQLRNIARAALQSSEADK